MLALLFLCRQLPMLQFLGSLLAYLPTFCSVQSVKGTRGQGASQIFSLTLEKEVGSLREFVSLLLCGEHKDEENKKMSTAHHETPEPGSVEGLRRCREEWQQDMDRSRMRLSPLVDVGKYRNLTQNLSEVQLDGDLAALVEAQRNLLS